MNRPQEVKLNQSDRTMAHAAWPYRGGDRPIGPVIDEPGASWYSACALRYEAGASRRVIE